MSRVLKRVVIMCAIAVSSSAQDLEEWRVYERRASEIMAEASEPFAFGDPKAATSSRSFLLAAEMAKTGEEAKAVKGTKDFAGLSFGVALSLTIDSSDDRVKEAKIVNNVVRVTKEENVVPRVMLESHKFVWTWGSRKEDEVQFDRYGFGPFVGIVPNQDSIEAYAVGVMWGFRADTTGQSFNLAIGVINDRKVQTLGDGFEENAAPPAGESEVRYKEADKWAGVLVASFSF